MEDGKVMIHVLYEDNHLLVVEKPINIPVQADDSKDPDFLNLLKKYIKDKYNKPGNVYVALLHRLDRPVGGVMVFAKTSKAANRLTNQIKNHEVQKKYYAVLEGTVEKKEDILVDYLQKNHKENKVYVDKRGKKAILSYKVLQKRETLTLVEIDLQTGRSHQIRVQFSSRGMPLYGDQKYNSNGKKNTQIALYAKELSFYHPINKEKMVFTLPLPNRYPFTLFKIKEK